MEEKQKKSKTLLVLHIIGFLLGLLMVFLGIHLFLGDTWLNFFQGAVVIIFGSYLVNKNSNDIAEWRRG